MNDEHIQKRVLDELDSIPYFVGDDVMPELLAVLRHWYSHLDLDSFRTKLVKTAERERVLHSFDNDPQGVLNELEKNILQTQAVLDECFDEYIEKCATVKPALRK